MSERNIVVVGAGLAGLCCARTIQRAGHTAHIYEASDDVGGRVRTDVVDGFTLDRGFQVLFTSYPAIRQEFDLDALDLQIFTPGAVVIKDACRYVLADPLRSPAKLLPTALSPLFSLQDKLNVAKLSALLLRMSINDIFNLPDKPMGDYLREFGFSEEFLSNFIRPFFAGIFLERELQTSARMFAFVFKMLAQGQTAVPAAGMGAMGKQIAADLKPGTLHLNSPVRELIYKSGQVVGVRLEDGQSVDADRVVVATEFDKTAQLADLHIPATWRVSTTLYFEIPEPLYREKLIALFPGSSPLVNSATPVTNVAPSHAPPGKHLISCTVLGNPTLSDEELAHAVRQEMKGHFPDADTDAWRLIRIYRIPWAQYAQPTGIFEKLPEQRTARPGLILAGEIAVTSSLDGALKSGQRAAGLAMSVGG